MEGEAAEWSSAYDEDIFAGLAHTLAESYPTNVTRELLEVMRRTAPNIARLVVEDGSLRGTESARELWVKVRERPEIRQRLRDLLKDVNRQTVIYFLTKFENNEFLGTNMVRRALEAEHNRIRRLNSPPIHIRERADSLKRLLEVA